jgi:hypothetical protein
VTEVPSEDLAPILSGLMRAARRKTDAGRRLLANDELTREYLEAGRRLIDAQLGPGDDTDAEDRPLFRWLSQRAVIDEVTSGGNRLHGSEGTFRDRWPYQPDFIRDVFAYSLRGAHWQDFVDRTAGSRDRLADAEDIVQAVHDAAYDDLTVSLRSSANRTWLIGAAMAARDEIARTTLRQMYQISTRAWQDAYEKAAAARGLRPRKGLTIEDLNYIITAVSEGIQVRLMVEEDGLALDHERRTSLLGVAALAVVVACFDHLDDGLSLEELVRVAVGSPDRDTEAPTAGSGGEPAP